MFGPYLLGVELASMLLLAGLLGAYHLGQGAMRIEGGVDPDGDGIPWGRIAGCGVLFCIGLTGVLVRRNILFILLSIEIMLNACGLAFVLAGAHWAQPDGQVMYFFILTMAAAEVAVGLSLVLQMYRHFGSLDANVVNKMRG